MNLTEYLVARGSKMLMPCEAAAFGIPHPLERHWAATYAGNRVTMAGLEAIYRATIRDRRPCVAKVRQGLLLAAQACVAEPVGAPCKETVGAVGLPWNV